MGQTGLCAKATHGEDGEDVQPEGKATLDEIFQKYGTDKSIFFHGYSGLYESLFEPFRYDDIRLCEIGIGTLIPGLPDTMRNHILSYEFSQHYAPGASLRAWRDYFPHAKLILGVDVAQDCMFEEGNIQTILASSFDQVAVQNQLGRIGSPQFDIIIDDGLHTPEANIGTFLAFEPYLKRNGYYIIEDFDLENFDHSEGQKIIDEIRKRGGYEYEMNVVEDHGSRPLIVIKKSQPGEEEEEEDEDEDEEDEDEEED